MADLGKYVGARLMCNCTVFLNVYGAEESPDYAEYDQQFDGKLWQCLEKLKEWQKVIWDNSVDAYLAISLSYGYSDYYREGDLERILDALLEDEIITDAEYDKYCYYRHS